MPVSADYIVRETASNLWRNRLMTIAAILTVTVSLSLVGAALLLKQGAAQAEDNWQRGTQVTVWMQASANDTEIQAVRTELATVPYVDQPCAYWTQRRDYHEAIGLLRTVYTDSGVTVAQTPSSFRCVPVHLEDAGQLVTKFSGQAGVLTVSEPQAQIRSEQKTINVLQIVFLVIALVLLISASVLILNTIRMAIFARRREVSVMKLVGATNWFIRFPFMAEGMIQGLVGSALAAVAVVGLNLLVIHLGNSQSGPNLATIMRLTGWKVVGTDAVVLIVGAGVGTLGSAIAIRRFLDV